MKNSGVTLIEMLIVVAIAGILAIAFGFSYIGWQGTYKVESQIKELYTDILDARQRAMQRGRLHFVSLETATSYVVSEDDSDGAIKVPDGDGIFEPNTSNPDDNAEDSDDRLPTFPKTTEYDILWNRAVITEPYDLTFNTRGIATTLGNISFFIDRDGDGKKDFCPDYDCISISATRVKMGQLCAPADNNECCEGVSISDADCIEK